MSFLKFKRSAINIKHIDLHGLSALQLFEIIPNVCDSLKQGCWKVGAEGG